MTIRVMVVDDQAMVREGFSALLGAQDGIGATEIIAREYPEVRVLILTTFDLDEYAFAALRAGASGFLLKDAKPGELVGAIRAVASGDAAVSPRITRRMLEMFAGYLPENSQSQGAAAPGHGVDDPRLRERIMALGGALSAGPRTDGRGWVVEATLPLPDQDASGRS